MTDLPAAKQLIQLEETQYRMPTSENMLQKMGSAINYALTLPVFSAQTVTSSPGAGYITPSYTVSIDSASGWNGTGYVIPVTGIYYIASAVDMYTPSNAYALRTHWIYRNGSIIIAECQICTFLPFTNFNATLSCFNIVSLSQGDVITTYCYANSVVSGVAAGTNFIIQRVG